MKAWITKYALTQRIVEVEGEIRSASMFIVKTPLYDCCYHGEGKDWHRTRESAVARAETQRLMRIKSVKKQLAKLEALKFQ